MIELRETEINALVGMGLLTTEMRNDPNAVSEALYAHLEQTLAAVGRVTAQENTDEPVIHGFWEMTKNGPVDLPNDFGSSEEVSLMSRSLFGRRATEGLDIAD